MIRVPLLLLAPLALVSATLAAQAPASTGLDTAGMDRDVKPGDAVVADDDGVVVVPRLLAEATAAKAQQRFGELALAARGLARVAMQRRERFLPGAAAFGHGSRLGLLEPSPQPPQVAPVMQHEHAENQRDAGPEPAPHGAQAVRRP